MCIKILVCTILKRWLSQENFKIVDADKSVSAEVCVYEELCVQTHLL